MGAEAETAAQEQHINRLENIIAVRQFEVLQQHRTLQADLQEEVEQKTFMSQAEAGVANSMHALEASTDYLENKTDAFKDCLISEAEAYSEACRNETELQMRLDSLHCEMFSEERAITELRDEVGRRMTLPQVWQYILENDSEVPSLLGKNSDA